jgi:hypothetical protein
MSIPFSGEPSATQPKPAGSQGMAEPKDADSERVRSASPSVHGRTSDQGHFDTDQFFGRQATPSELLPPPEPLLENLTRCVSWEGGSAKTSTNTSSNGN